MQKYNRISEGFLGAIDAGGVKGGFGVGVNKNNIINNIVNNELRTSNDIPINIKLFNIFSQVSYELVNNPYGLTTGDKRINNNSTQYGENMNITNSSTYFGNLLYFDIFNNITKNINYLHDITSYFTILYFNNNDQSVNFSCDINIKTINKDSQQNDNSYFISEIKKNIGLYTVSEMKDMNIPDDNFEINSLNSYSLIIIENVTNNKCKITIQNSPTLIIFINSNIKGKILLKNDLNKTICDKILNLEIASINDIINNEFLLSIDIPLNTKLLNIFSSVSKKLYNNTTKLVTGNKRTIREYTKYNNITIDRETENTFGNLLYIDTYYNTNKIINYIYKMNTNLTAIYFNNMGPLEFSIDLDIKALDKKITEYDSKNFINQILKNKETYYPFSIIHPKIDKEKANIGSMYFTNSPTLFIIDNCTTDKINIRFNNIPMIFIFINSNVQGTIKLDNNLDKNTCSSCKSCDKITCPQCDKIICPQCEKCDKTICPKCETSDKITCPQCDKTICPQCDKTICPKCDKTICPPCDKTICPPCDKTICPPCEKPKSSINPIFIGIIILCIIICGALSFLLMKKK